MKKRLIAGVMVVALICSMGAITAMAAEGEDNARPSFGQRGGRGERREISEADKAQMEAAMAQHKEKLDAFVDTLTAEQNALYEAMKPAAPANGQRFEKPADGQRPAMGQRNADGQRLERPADGQRPERPDNIQRPERPDNSAMTEAREAFVASLTDEQKAAYEELMDSMNHGGFRIK
jgi:hypothetical protein